MKAPDGQEMPGTQEKDVFLPMEMSDAGTPSTRSRGVLGCIYDWWCVPKQTIITTATQDDHGSADPEAKKFDLFRFLQCSVGILVAYLAWGYLQEYIMTQHYESVSTGELDDYPKGWSPFLVLQNRLFTLVFATIMLWRETPTNFAPRYKYALISFANTA